MVYDKIKVDNNKYTLAKLFEKGNSKPTYYLKERKKSSIKGHKTQYWLQDSNFHNFSSLFTNKDHQKTDSKDIKGKFSLELGNTYYLDNQGKNYKLIINLDTVEIAPVKITKFEVQNALF